MPCAPWLVSRGISSIAIHLDRRAAFHRMLAEWREIFPLLELCPYIFGYDERVAEVLVRPSMREAVFTASPITVYSCRSSEPTWPTTTSPTCRPMPIASG